MQSPASDVISRSQFIRAGAGAGKTTKLISSFLEFVRHFQAANGRLPRVVMTTFTRKATQEVKERLLVSALKAGEKDIFEYINKKSYVHISTIHGLLSLYLNQYAERLKFPQEIKIVDGVQYDRTLKKKINELLKKNPAYLEILESYSFLQLVTLADQALNDKAQHRGYTFVSADELRRIARQKKDAIVMMIQHVFEKVAAPPAAWAEYFGFLKNVARLIQQNDEPGLLEYLEQGPAKPRWSNAKPPFDPEAHAVIEELKDERLKHLFNTEDYILKHEALNRLFLEFIQDLEIQVMQHKRSTGELTISDLENISLRLIEEHPDTAREFSDSWDYFMIDEYQDTSPLQVRILNSIVREKPSFIVGDPQQSIYLFRGARSEVFEAKQNEMLEKKAAIGFLETNYRSEPSLMNFINSYFTGFSPQFKPMVAKDPAPEAAARALEHDAFFIKAEEQPVAVLNHLNYLLGRGIDPQDICVLSRSNNKLVDLAVKANAAGIPVQLQTSAGFEEKREILDLMAFNRFLNNPHDNENLVMLLRSPWFYVSDQDLLAFAQSPRAKTLSLWSVIQESAHPRKADLAGFLGLFDSAGSLQATRTFVAQSGFLSLSAYYDQTGKREANVFKYLAGLARAEQTPGFSLGLFLEEQFQSLQSDLGSLNAEAQPVIQPNCVSLMTVHASKGLQFKHVIVMGFADTPQVSKAAKLTFDDQSEMFSLAVLDETTSKHEASDWSSQIVKKFNERELSENERVLYVALTRAIESVTLVAETGKRSVSEKSWFKRTVWPEPGESAGGDHKVLSVTYEEAVVGGSRAEPALIQARKPFAEKVLNTFAASSVTEMIESKPGGKAGFDDVLTNLKKAQRGTDLHRVFESLKFLDEAQILKSLPAADRPMVQYLLQEPKLNLRQILQLGHNEWGFGLKLKDRMIQGQIDLWGELPEEVHVLDYKTGSPAYAEKAFEQLAFYTMALFQMKQISSGKKIVHSVVYPADQVIRQKTFLNAGEFYAQLNPKIAEIFKNT